MLGSAGGDLWLWLFLFCCGHVMCNSGQHWLPITLLGGKCCVSFPCCGHANDYAFVLLFLVGLHSLFPSFLPSPRLLLSSTTWWLEEVIAQLQWITKLGLITFLSTDLFVFFLFFPFPSPSLHIRALCSFSYPPRLALIHRFFTARVPKDRCIGTCAGCTRWRCAVWYEVPVHRRVARACTSSRLHRVKRDAFSIQAKQSPSIAAAHNGANLFFLLSFCLS